MPTSSSSIESELPADLGPRTPKTPSRLYALTVVSLAVFFVGLIAWRVPGEGYLAVSEVGRRAFERPGHRDSVAHATADTWEGPQLSALQQALADAIRYADARLASSEPDPVAQVSDERIRSTFSRLTIDALTLEEGNRAIRISFTGPDPTWSLALVEHLTRDCLLGADGSAESQIRSARAIRNAQWNLDQTRHYERKARYGVEDLMDVCFAEFTQNPKNGELFASVSAGRRDEFSSGEASDVAAVNPQWQHLQSQLAEMSQQLRPLVEHLTPNHPHILDLTRRMDQVREQLEATPQYLGSSVSQTLSSSGMPNGAVGAQMSHVAAVIEAFAEDYQELRGAYERAIGNREAAERRLSGLLARPWTEDQPRDTESSWLILPPTLQGRIGGQSSAGRVGIIGLFALFCGAGAAWSLGTLKALQQVNTVADLEAMLAVPVVGQLSIDPAPAAVSRLAVRRRILRTVVTAAEVTLGLMVVLFATGAMEGSAASQMLKGDPFTAIPDTVLQALQRWF